VFKSVKNGCAGSDVERVCGRVMLLLCVCCVLCVCAVLLSVLSSLDADRMGESRRALHEQLVATILDLSILLHSVKVLAVEGDGWVTGGMEDCVACEVWIESVVCAAGAMLS